MVFIARELGAMITRRTWIRRAIVIGTAGVGAEQLWRHGHDYVLPSQFVTVEPGKIYRGAWQKPWPMRRIVNNYKIKTILALAHPPNHYLSVQERQLTTELGVKWIHIPIVDNRGTNDRAAEDAISDLLDQAAAVLADPCKLPPLFSLSPWYEPNLDGSNCLSNQILRVESHPGRRRDRTFGRAR